ncbi:MAG: histidine triad nucleotide-binding protein [Gemmatimonadaceae bacterium]
MPDDCLFCRIVRGVVPATLVAKNDDCIAFRDVNPQAPTHILIVPREHISSLDAAKDPEMIGKVAFMAAELARAEGIATTGYRTVINTGADAGETVHHLHMHLLGGRVLKWPPG